MKYEFLSLLINESEKLSFAFIAGFLAFHFGASEYLLLLVQYLFISDFVVGILDATKAKKFSWSRIWIGIKKMISLYFGVLVVGFGTRAFDVALQGRIDIDYNGALFFDIFIYILIIFELASINRHLARLGFAVNMTLEKNFERITLKILEVINRKIDKM